MAVSVELNSTTATRRLPLMTSQIITERSGEYGRGIHATSHCSLGRVHEHLHGRLVELVERGAVLVGGVGRLARRVAHRADRPQLVDRERPHDRPLHRQHTNRLSSARDITAAAVAVSDVCVTALSISTFQRSQYVKVFLLDSHLATWRNELISAVLPKSNPCFNRSPANYCLTQRK